MDLRYELPSVEIKRSWKYITSEEIGRRYWHLWGINITLMYKNYPCKLLSIFCDNVSCCLHVLHHHSVWYEILILKFVFKSRITGKFAFGYAVPLHNVHEVFLFSSLSNKLYWNNSLFNVITLPADYPFYFGWALGHYYRPTEDSAWCRLNHTSDVFMLHLAYW